MEHHDSDSQGSFNMSGMLFRDQSKADMYDMGTENPNFGSAGGLPSLNSAHNIDVDDIGIQDDLAISDSDEDEDDQKPPLNNPPNKAQSDNANMNDDDLWF